jgi:Mg-chelatase subunit ChlD
MNNALVALAKGNGREIDGRKADALEALKKKLQIEKIPTGGYVYLVVDTSGSMKDNEKLDQAKNGSQDFGKDAHSRGYAVGLINFDSEAEHLCEPTNELETLNSRLRSLSIGGSTRMDKGIRIAREKLERLDTRSFKAIVIATDGMPDYTCKEETIVEANKAKAQEIEIITIGTGDADEGFLKLLASRKDLGEKVAPAKFRETIKSSAGKLPLLIAR